MAKWREKILYPVEITADNNGISWNYNGDVFNATVAAGTYLVSDDGAGYLLSAIRSAMIAAGSTPVSWAACTPGLSIGQEWCGLRAFITNPAHYFRWRFQAPHWTLDPRLLGFPGDQNTEVESVLDYRNGADLVHSIASPYTYLGAWHPWGLLANKGALSRKKSTRAERYSSGGKASARYTLTWYEETDRTITYDWIPAANLYEERALDVEYARMAGLAVGDTHNALSHLFERLGADKTCTVVYYTSEQSGVYAQLPDYEDVRLKDEESLKTMESLLTQRRMSGELYRVELPLVVVGGGFDGV